MAALAIVIMCLGGLIPFATFVCPMLCCMITKLVLSMCGKRIAWAWYGAVAILSVLMAPDKEAAAVFVFLGYYPIVKPWMDKRKLHSMKERSSGRTLKAQILSPVSVDGVSRYGMSKLFCVNAYLMHSPSLDIKAHKRKRPAPA